METTGSGELVPSQSDGDEALVAKTRRSARDFWLSPSVLSYAMAPLALGLILLLERFHLIAKESSWVWVAVFVAIPSLTVVADIANKRWPGTLTLHVRIAYEVVAVTSVTYLTGWGPVLIGTFAFIALENIARGGSRTWRATALWSLIGIIVGQVLVARHIAPSFLSEGRGVALAVMGGFVLLFVIRMAATTMERQEIAEAAMALSEERFRSLVQNSSDTTLVIGPEILITYASPACEALLGWQPAEMIGMSAVDLMHPDDRDWVSLQLNSLLQIMAVTEPIQFRMSLADGGWRHVEAVVTNQLESPSVLGYVANVRDITERKEAEALLAHQALHDPLTGLPNRQLIMDRAQQMLARARRHRQPVAAFFIDLDNFKDANDTLGHDAGDKLLQAVARRFVGILREGDTVGRLGGDEFVVLAEGSSLSAGPEVVAERILDVLREPFRLEGYEQTSLAVSASIGIAFGDRGTAQDLIRDADVALYQAKAAGKHCSTLFETAMQTEIIDRLGLKLDLHSALDRQEYFLLYQPVFDLDQVRTCGVEALLRWRHPVRGVVAPDEFIPTLEDTGEIVEVGRWVLDEACRQAAVWHDRGHTLTMSVNVSMRQLETDAFIDDVRQALVTSGLDPGSLIIEITESTLMRDADATIDRLRALKALGVLIAIDDFGTGYSSLAYLRRFPVDALKIDRSFVAAMDDSTESAALIHTLVELGRTLGLETLAEGIEDQAQLDGLRDEACELGQGFFYSRPVDAEAIEAFLTEAHPNGLVPRPAPRADLGAITAG